MPTAYRSSAALSDEVRLLTSSARCPAQAGGVPVMSTNLRRAGPFRPRRCDGGDAALASSVACPGGYDR
jgi:hypothetical protein